MGFLPTAIQPHAHSSQLAPLGSFRRQSKDTAAEIESGRKGLPSGLANIKSKSFR